MGTAISLKTTDYKSQVQGIGMVLLPDPVISRVSVAHVSVHRGHRITSGTIPLALVTFWFVSGSLTALEFTN